MNTQHIEKITQVDHSLSKVLPRLLLVPNGYEAGRLRATLICQPFCDPSGFPIGQWPEEISKFLSAPNSKISVEVSHIPDSMPGETCRAAAAITPDNMAVRTKLESVTLAWSDVSDANAHLSRLSRLWSSSLAPGGDSDWEALCTLLTPTAPISVTESSTEQPSKSVALDESKLGADGQIEPSPGTSSVKGIVNLPHGDMALALEHQRAGELLYSMQAGAARLVSAAAPAGQSQGAGQSKQSEAPEDAKYAQDQLRKNRAKQLQRAMVVVDTLRSTVDGQEQTTGVAVRLVGEGAADPDQREAALNAAAAALDYGTWPEYANAESKTSAADSVKPRFLGLQSSPVLSRLFGLAHDLQVSVGSEALPGLQGTRYAFVRVVLDGEVSMTSQWVLCRMRPDPGHSDPLHFWPCTTEEMLACQTTGESKQPENLTQYGGVMVMGRHTNCQIDEERIHAPRFDVTSLDVRQAADQEIQRRKLMDETTSEQSKTYLPRLEIGTTNGWPELEFGGTQQTAGLTLLYLGAKEDAARKLTRRKLARKSAQTASTFLDAEDLTIGFRPQVGIPSQKKNGSQISTDWSPLMARDVLYGTSGPAGVAVIETILQQLIKPPASRKQSLIERQGLEEGFVTFASRLLSIPTKDGGTHTDMLADEALLTWDGSPMGVDCSGAAEHLKDQIREAFSFGRRVSLPTSGARRPHRLRFGWGYRFALLPVYLGGVSLPERLMPRDDNITEAQCENDIHGRLYYPPARPMPGGSGALSFVRSLRHERMAAPFVLLTSRHATLDHRPMAPEVARKMVIRTVTTSAGSNVSQERAKPRISQRILLAPSVSFELAAQHGLFDNPKIPRTAYPYLRAVKQSKTGELVFPQVLTQSRRGFGGRPFYSGRKVQQTAEDGLNGGYSQSGDPVFDTEKNGPRVRHYPDPMARQFAIGLRRPGSAEYVMPPHLASFWDERGSPFDSRPIVLTVRPSTYPNGLSIKSGNGRVDSRPATEITINLPEGEEYDLDIWSIADPAALARYFAVIETMGVQLAPKMQRRTDSALLSGVRRNLGHAAASTLASLLLANRGQSDRTFVSRGGVVAPSARQLRALSNFVGQVHARQPLPELSSVQTLRVVHATNRPRAAATIAQSKTPPRMDGSHWPSVTPETPPGPLPIWAARLAATDPAIRDAGPTSDAEVIPRLSETGLALGGEIAFDAAKVGTIEIIARMVNPGTSLFDDPRRGRDPAHIMAGVWPERLLPALRNRDGSPPAQTYRTSAEIFGFSVAPDGRVTFPEAEVTLLRIENPPQDGTGKISLSQYFAAATKSANRAEFTDGKARIMHVRVNSLSRTANEMATIDHVVKGSDTPFFPGLVDGEFAEAAPLSAAEVENFSNEIQVVMPASERPLKCDALASEPALNWTRLSSRPPNWRRIHLVRDACVRICLGRGWCSSGEGERLGIAVWPPALRHEQIQDVARNRVALQSAGATRSPEEEVRIINLPNFTDADLGPGGRFVTRRGSDPVRGGGNETTFLMHFDDFLDIGQASGAEASIVSEALMPLSEDAPPKGSADEAVASHPPLTVSLVTYEPRFDVSREEWYVDVRLRPSKAAEPMIRFGLVRYQPHTIASLRCSLPVETWAQPLPRRDVIIRRLSSGAIYLLIYGPGNWQRKDVPADRPYLAMPLLRVTLSLTMRDAEGRPISTALEINQSSEGPRDFLILPARRRGPGLVWYGMFGAESLESVPQGARLRLNVEEVEMFPPSTRDIEPFEGEETDGRYSASGPRMLCEADLTSFLLRG